MPPFVLAAAGVDLTVEPYAGAGPAGPVYGPPVTVRAVVEHARRLVLDASGTEAVGESTARAPLGVDIPPESRVTLPDGRTTTVIVTRVHDGGRLPVPSHVEVVLR